MGTSHELGQNFARVFEIQYLDANGELQLCWTTSWGTSTRMVGGLIMAHGDDAGLRVPPRLAPIQVVVLVVKESDDVSTAAAKLAGDLAAAGVRVRVDERVDQGFGRRTVDWELKGVPLRIEVGPRDLAEGNVTLVDRLRGGKQQIGIGQVAALVPGMLEDQQRAVLAEATAARDARIADAGSVAEAAEAAAEGWARLPWALLREADGETKLREVGITVRCLQRPDGSLPDSEDEADTVAYAARAY
jgi:prolyl-tRNA synthetase